MTNANNSAAAELSNEFGRPALLVSFKTLTPISSRPKATEQFPIDQVTDSIATAIRAVSVIADCHINTAAWAVFGSASAAAQTIALVETPAGHIVPASTFTYLIAPSGCRKSTVFSAAWQGIFDADTQLQKAHRKRKAALVAQSKGKGTRPVTTDQELCRSAGTIKQIITEPSMEALMRDADTGHPYPAIANPEGQSFLLGFSAGTDPKRAAQTASLLSAGYSSENTNVPRIGADGKAPNRSLDAGQYALGMHLAVQDHSMGIQPDTRSSCGIWNVIPRSARRNAAAPGKAAHQVPAGNAGRGPTNPTGLAQSPARHPRAIGLAHPGIRIRTSASRHHYPQR